MGSCLRQEDLLKTQEQEERGVVRGREADEEGQEVEKPGLCDHADGNPSVRGAVSRKS